MKKKHVDRMIDVSDGLASFTHKKFTTLLNELSREGVFTAKEEARIKKRLDGVKNKVYKSVSDELRDIAKDLYDSGKGSSKKSGSKSGKGKKK